MFAVHGVSHGIEALRVPIVIGAVLMVVFWRALLKIVIIVATILILYLISSGAVALLQGAQHVIK